MTRAYWPNFHGTKMSVTLSMVVLSVCCQFVMTSQSTFDNVRLLLSSDTGDDECALQTSSNYTGHCHCSSLLDIHCTAD